MTLAGFPLRRALAESGVRERIVELAGSAATAREAARALGVDLGAFAKSLVSEIGSDPVMALIAGDRRCNEEKPIELFGLEGEVRRPDPARVEELTGSPAGGVAPGIRAASWSRASTICCS